MPRLILNPGTQGAQIFELQPGDNTIGRRPTNPICIPDNSLSSQHCRITHNNESVVLTDLNSTNGTFVEGERIAEATLKHGQRIRLGNLEFLFEEDGDETTVAPETAKPRTRVRIAVPSERDSTEVGSTTVLNSEESPQAEAPREVLHAGETYCKFHSHSLAQFYCGKCRKYFCDLCVAARHVESRLEHFCRACGEPCQPVSTAAAPVVQEPFARLAGRAFRYPFEGGGAFLVATGTLFLALLDLLSWVVSFAFLFGFAASIILTVLGGGYLFAFVKSVVQSSAQGADTLPDWPDISNLFEDMVVPFFQSLVLLVFCEGPGIALMIYGEANENQPFVMGGAVLIFLGVCYLPMGLLGIAMYDSIFALNPLLGIPSMARTVGHYFLTLVIFFTLLATSAGLEVLFTEVLPIPIISTVLSAFVTFYALVVLARSVGVLYRVNQDALGWFKSRNR